MPRIKSPIPVHFLFIFPKKFPENGYLYPNLIIKAKILSKKLAQFTPMFYLCSNMILFS